MKKMGFIKKIANINSNKFTSVLALLISLGTFTLLFYEIKLTREQQYVSVLPYLSISQSIPSTGSYRLYVVNDGIGPAFIEEVRFEYNDQIYKGDGYHVYKQIYKNKASNDTIYSSGFKGGNMLPSGSTSNIIGTSSNQETANRIRDLFMNENMVIEIIYSSVYGEKWVFNNKEGVKKIDD